ncbi:MULTISPECIES: hypothetical protein [Haloferax]|uniref:Uncharacterized protein n=2 Tax=Haloferax TaxID=2251 RepID=A0A0D6JNI0_9EURY|nr:MULTISPECIES: hypothetical protein [Haloferax]GGC44285.1 hypothetical protein GCM10007209_02400 [Haloferax sulfurifontis]CQR49451.1 hypothetical protein BN996_00912 [Haloferax massiliensis]
MQSAFHRLVAAASTEVVVGLADNWLNVVIVGDVVFFVGCLGAVLWLTSSQQTSAVETAVLFVALGVAGAVLITEVPVVREAVSAVAFVFALALPIGIAVSTVDRLMKSDIRS